LSRYAIGIDLGGTKVEACLIDENRMILARKRRPSEPRLGGEKVVANIFELVADTAAGAPYEAIGMGTPGTYHAGDDILYGAPHTPGRRIPLIKAVLGDSAGVFGAAFLGLRAMGLMEF